MKGKLELEVSNENLNSKYLENYLEKLLTEEKVSEKDLKKIVKNAIKKKERKELVAKKSQNNIPLSIFKSEKLSSLQSVVKYYREEKSFTYQKIAQILKRNTGPIGITYRNSKTIHPKKLSINFEYELPPEIFHNKSLSVLESIVGYLKEKLNFKLVKIARLLSRDPRTIWTVYSRYKAKNE